MPVRIALLLLVCLWLVTWPAAAKEPVSHLRYRQMGVPATALDEYVAKPDDSFAWEVVNQRTEGDMLFFVIRLTSQTWQPGDVEPGVWKHWLLVTAPKDATSSIGMLFISGGRRNESQPAAPNPMLMTVAKETTSVVAELRCVPNQPLVFAGDGVERTEDDLLAESWKSAIEDKNVAWLGQLPMAKAAVRAMDALEQFTASEKSLPELSRFVVAGASKRGWTTWLAAAVDTRVEAIVPIVIDMLNIRPSLNHQLQVYGEWSPALDDYAARDFDHKINDGQFDALLELVDPYSYRDRLDMPKCLVNASGDEFFLPDSSQFYFDSLVGEKHLAYVPNAGHSLAGSNAIDTIIGFYSCVLAGEHCPNLEWEVDATQCCLSCEQPPDEVLLWHAENQDSRDFRLATVGPRFVSKPLANTAEGDYRIEIDELPNAKWVAYFAQAVFDSPSGRPLRLTTPVWVRGADE